MAAVGRRAFCATAKFSAANVLVVKRTLPCVSRHRHCFRQQFSSSSQERGKWDESETGSGRSHTETAEEALAQARTLVPLGITALGVGITLLTLNERRDVQQAALTERARHVCETYDANADTTPHSSLNDHLLHTYGRVDANEPVPIDSQLNVSQPGALRLKRTTEMFQWVEQEHRETTKHKDGSETTRKWYTYTQEWSARHQPVSNSSDGKYNPTFPDEIRSRTFEAEGGLLLGKAKFQLCKTMRGQIDQFRPLTLNPENTGQAEELGARTDYDLVVIDNGQMLYSKGRYSNGRTPSRGEEVGDVRVVYSYVAPGDYTAVGRLKEETLDVYADAVKPRLAAQGAIEVAPEVEVSQPTKKAGPSFGNPS